MDPAKYPVPALPAASVLLLRDSPDSLEVLMMERHSAMGFAAGALVFPGGKIDPSDEEDALAARALSSGSEGDAGDLMTFSLGAMRELFEEAGILMATDSAGKAVECDRAAALAERHRTEVLTDPARFAAMLESEELYLSDGLVHFAHWITPEPVPKRFDTHFFAAPAPEGQNAVRDGHEAVAMAWMSPAETLEMGASGEKMLMFPTRLNLQRLLPAKTVAEALEAAREAKVVTVMPKPVIEDGELYMTIPTDAGYAETKIHRDNIPEVAGGPSGRGRKSR